MLVDIAFSFQTSVIFFLTFSRGDISVALPHEMVEFWDIRLVGYSLELLKSIINDKVMTMKRQVTECTGEIG